jgi:NAD(P)-dependent dehydrogenase (short-subunit alcohol dehydrogenase family)
MKMGEHSIMSVAESKCAVIVGAGTGTGSEVSKLFAREGFSVVLARRTSNALEPLVAEIEESGGSALAVGADASDERQVSDLFDQAEQRFGPPRFVLFNAAGFLMAPVVDLESEQFAEMWRATSFGGFLVGREAARRMLPAGQGTILFTGATAAVKANANFSAFAAGKHGLRAAAQSMAKELGPKGIHVAHLIIDGIIDVPRVHEHMPEMASAKGENGLIDPESIAATMLWLHRQPKNAWTFELDLRPFKEAW